LFKLVSFPIIGGYYLFGLLPFFPLVCIICIADLLVEKGFHFVVNWTR
jgi:hypothetical protein